MSYDSIVERIISDARAEADVILAEAEKKAEERVALARTEADRKLLGVKAEVARKVKSISDGKAATARLDGAKAGLAEKRRVMDSVYSAALEKLVALSKKEALLLSERLLEEHAEEGDEIVFAESFKYVSDVAALGVVKEKKLAVSKKRADIDGGFVLCGKSCDKDLSYSALLAADREEHQAEIAAEIFMG